MPQTKQAFEKDYSKYGFHDKEDYVFKSGKGLSKELIEEISRMKKEPEWMLKFRLKSLEEYYKRPMPQWGANLNTIDFENIHYYVKPSNQSETSWDDVPVYIKDTFNKLGIPEAEQKFLGGVGAQYESEVVYHKIREDLEKLGVVFLDMDGGLREYPEIVKKYFGTVVPYNDNKFAALNSAAWSGGSFVYVPKGVKVDLPLQAYFRINTKNMGQFERTLIIAEPGSSVHYIEGCFEKGAPIKTPEGIKKIEEVKEGDIVLTHTNTYKKVYKTMKRIHNGTMCTINYYGNTHDKIRITGGHPVLAVEKADAQNKEWEYRWIEAKDLELNDYVAMPNDEESVSNENFVENNTYENGTSVLLKQEVISNNNYVFTPITEIKKEIVEDVEVYNFSVVEDESYIAHGIVVHNCTAPIYSSDSLHSAVVELIAMPGSRIQYTTIQNWSNNVYNLVTKRAFAYEDATVFWVDGNLGCLTGDTKIFLNSDIKPIAEVESGNIVFSLDENFELKEQKVVARKYSGKQKVYTMKTINQREIKATANHPFLVLKKNGRISCMEWMPLKEIHRGDLIAISGDVPESGEPYKITFNSRRKDKIKIPIETNENLMWLFGLYMGDGYCDGGRVHFAIPEEDKSCKKLIETLKDIFGIEGKRRGVVLRINSVELVRFFMELGFKGNARTKKIPEWVFKLPKSQKTAFINGYIDADGHYRDNHKNISITSCNRNLLEDVKNLAMTCGLNPTKISKWTRREKKPLGLKEKEYTHYFLYFGEGKFQKPIGFVPVTEISYFGEEDTWDIEVDGSHNFVADGFIVHNSKITMKYPSIFLLGERARAEILSVAFAGKGQHQDAGGKILHYAPNTTSRIVSKSVSKDGGRTTYRGLLKVAEGCHGVKSHVTCDALILDDKSASDTVPYMEINEKNVNIEHEATVGKIGEEQLFYLMSRGLSEDQAMTMVVSGFMEPFTKELPLEYAIELNRLIAMNMEGSVG